MAHMKYASGRKRSAFTLIELLVVIAIIAILAVVVVLTLNPAELLRQSRDANRVSDIATLTSALNLYVTDQTGNASFSLGNANATYPSIFDPSATSTLGTQCQGLGFPALGSGEAWQCAASSTYRNATTTGWIPVNFSAISSGNPLGSLPVDPANQTSSGLFYGYNTNGSQFAATANLESQKYKAQYGNNPQTNLFPEVISGGTPSVSALYDPAGLMGYWPLNEGSGTVAFDQSGNGNAGAWQGSIPYYTSNAKVGSWAGNFDGSTNYLNAGTAFQNLGTAGDFSGSLWINPSIIHTDHDPLGDKIYTGNFGGFRIFDNGTAFQFVPSTGLTLAFGSAPLGQWTHLAWSYAYASKILTIYKNGTAAASATSTFVSTTNPLWIGAGYTTGPSTVFGGSIDDVRIYGRAISAAEVMALYNAEK